MKSPTIFLSILTMLMIFSGCVGTVQNAAQGFTNVNDTPLTPMVFSGIANANAISDTRMEVFFYPADGGSGQYSYDIYVGNSPYPTSVPSKVLQPDYRGLLRVTIPGLSRLSSYQVKVEVRDTQALGMTTSNSQIFKTVTTFDNQVATFDGISSATNMPGQNGKDSVRLRFTPAIQTGGISTQLWDTSSYEVIIVDKQKLTPGDMDNTSLGTSEGRWVYQFNYSDNINEYVARGLPAKTQFYVRIRAIHYGSSNDVYDPRKRSELNTKYVTISTLSDSLDDLTFNSDSFDVKLATGEQGLNAIAASWSPASGVFDHYRLYYGYENGGVANGNFPEQCLNPLPSAPGTTAFCKRSDITSRAESIAGLEPYTLYEVALVLCQTVECGPSERIVGPTRYVTTDPLYPTFNGIREITEATSLEDIGTIMLNYDSPNFSSGYFDGLIIKMSRSTDGSGEIDITPETAPVFNEDYNLLTDGRIIIKGVQYGPGDPYCFRIFPFKWNTAGDEKRENSNDVRKCISLQQIQTPTALQFPGLQEASISTSNITLKWLPPEKGVFAEYELFWRKGSLDFSFGDAVSQAGNNNVFTNYGKQMIPSNLHEITLSGFAPGAYAFGIITYYRYVTDLGATTVRSETNGNILKCNVPVTTDGTTITCLK